MTKWDPRADEIFTAALAVDDPVDRSAFLDRSCGDDQTLRSAVEELLRSHEGAGSFLERPATGLHRTVDVNPLALEAGLSQAFDRDAAVVIGDRGHSVLKSLSKQLPRPPQVVLREGEAIADKVVQSKSSEAPTSAPDSRYQIHGEIARGGMGAIIKGRDTDLGRDLAIKVLLDSHKDKPDVMQRFVEEAQIGGQLQHPGIVPVYELGQFDDQRPFFTMKLVKGQTLAALLAKRNETADDLPKLLGVFEQICQTMAYAHSKGVIHRDLKPANIMVGAFGEVQVMDWGLAKVLGAGGIDDEQRSLDKHREVSVIQTRRSTGSDALGEVGSQTQMGSVMGTPAYMPPEQALGEVDRLDERADVFGLGAILAEILTGKPPYVADDSTQVFRMASRGKLDDCFARLDRCGAESELVELAKCALSPEPENRPPDAGHFASRMTQHLEGVQQRLKDAEMARAEAQARSEEERRRRKLYLTMAGLILALVGTGAYLLIAQQQLTIAQRERDTANAQATLASERAERVEAEARLEEQHSKKMESLAEVARLTARSHTIRKKAPLQSLLLAVEAGRRRPTGRALAISHEALLTASHLIGGQPLEWTGEGVTSIAISPDDRWLVTGAYTRTARLWDLKDGIPPTDPIELDGHSGNSLAFSPDNRWLVTGSDGVPAEVALWDLSALDIPASRRDLPVQHGSKVPCVEFSPDGRWLFVISKSFGELWAMTSGDPPNTRILLGAIPFNPEYWCWAMSPDSRWLVTRGNESLQVWDLTAADPSVEPMNLTQYSSPVRSMAISPDGQWLFTGGMDGELLKWDLTASREADYTPFKLGANGTGHTDAITGMAISPNGQWLVTGSADATALRWDLSPTSAASPTVMRGHDATVRRIVVSPDSRVVFTLSDDNTVRDWSLAESDPAGSSTVFRGHDSSLRNAVVTHDGRWLVTVANKVRFWDLDLKHAGSSPYVLRGHDAGITAVGFSPRGRWAATAGDDGVARLWDLRAGAPGNTTMELAGHTAGISSLLFTQDGRLVTASSDGTARVWSVDSRNGSTSARVLSGQQGALTAVAISPDGEQLAAASESAISLWGLGRDAADSPTHILKAADFSSAHVLFTPDGRRLIATGHDKPNYKNIGFWDLSDATPTKGSETLQFDGRTGTIALSPDGRWFVAGQIDLHLFDWRSSDHSSQALVTNGVFRAKVFSPDSRWLIATSWGTSRLWDLRSEAAASSMPRLRHDAGWVLCAAFAPNSEFVVTGGEDQTGKVWQLDPIELSSPLILRGHDGTVRCIAISPDSRWVLTGSDDHTARLWDLDVDALIERARGLAGRDLTAEEREKFGVLSVVE